MAMIDFAALCCVQEQLERPPRVLDVACGTGLLLKQVLEQVPDGEAYGVDASADMLAQAHTVLGSQLHVQLEQRTIGRGETANLPYAPATFDLITCTNVLHDLPEPLAVLKGLRRLLAPNGQLVIEDYARREPPFPWVVIEWLEKHIEGGRGRTYTLAEARALCPQAGLHVHDEKAFVVNWLWHGWVLRASMEASSV